MLRKSTSISPRKQIPLPNSIHLLVLNCYYNNSEENPPPFLPHLRRKPTATSIKIGSFLLFCNSQITQSGRAGNLHQAQSIFHHMPSRDVVSWTALLTAYAENGNVNKALELFDKMPHRNAASWNAMISAYTRNSKLTEAFQLFSEMPNKNLVSYSAIISGFAKSGMMREAEQIYKEMPSRWRDPVGSNALIHGYLKSGQIEEAVRVFTGMAARDVVSWSSLVDGYCKCGRISEAMQAFQLMPERNVVSWTAMVRGLLKSGNWEDGFRLFLNMRRQGVIINSTTLSVVLDACAQLSKCQEGIQIHGLVIVMGFEHDVFLGNSIIVLYSRFGWIDAARRWFDAMTKKDLVSWNSVINCYVDHDEIEEAYSLFQTMPEKDEVSWTSMLVGFSNRGWTEESIRLFEAMPEKDDVAWTAIISSFVGNGENLNAFKWFKQMLREGIGLNPLVLCSVFSALAGLAILDQGLQVHSLVLKLDLDSYFSVQTSLVSMYAKCGNLRDAYLIFLGIAEPNLIAMNSMITSFAQHGLADEALKLFNRMEADGSYKPNEVTFLGILSACSHSGLVEEGYRYFKCMSSCYGIEPGPDHYTCMVDLLGRAGLLTEAVSLIDSMPFRPNSAIWGALLNASRIHSDISLAKLAAKRLFELEPNNSTTYAVLSNMYSMAGMKEDEKEVRMAKQLKGLKKNPGYSWIVLDNTAAQITVT